MICTITTSKRPELFKRTVESFWTKCKDIRLITKVLIADDASSLADRESMLHTMKAVGREAGFTAGISDEPKGHPVNLQSVIDEVQFQYSDPLSSFYVHMEDDFVMTSKGCPIMAALDVLMTNPKLIQCCFGVERPVKWKKYRTRSGTQYSIRPRDISSEDSADRYPPFTLNPSVMRISAMKDVGPFENVEHFEKVFGDKANEKGYLVADLTPFWCVHIGNGNSAYDLNGTKR